MATTASEYYPYDAGTGANITEAQWRKMMGGTIQTGVIQGNLNGLAVTGDSSGMQVKLATGACWINGAYGENSTSVQTISIAASHATLNRYDLIVARNNYTTNVIEWDVIQGTNSASPTVPTVTIDTTKYEIALAYVYIGATVTTIAAANVTDVRTYIPGNNPTWWQELGRTKLTAAGDSISITGITPRKYLKVLVSGLNSGAILPYLRFNNDSSNIYAYQYSFSRAATATSTSTNLFSIQPASASESYGFNSEITIFNSASQYKIIHSDSIDTFGVDASTTVNFSEMWGKYYSLTQITRIDCNNSGAGDFAIGSEMVVLGHD